MRNYIKTLRGKSSLLSKFNSSYVLFLTLTTLIYLGLKSRWITQQGDAAGFVDAMTDQSKTGDINFTYGLSTKALSRLFADAPSQIDASQFFDPDSSTSFIHWHPYLFSYIPRIIPVRIFQIENLPLGLLAASYAFGITIIYRYMQKMEIPIRYRAIYTMIVLSSPVFIESIHGQPYFDKLFFGPCVGILVYIYSENRMSKRNFIKIIILIIVSITISERVSLIVSIVVIASLILKYRFEALRDKHLLALVILSIIGVVWYFFWQRYISLNPNMANSGVNYYWMNIRNLFTPVRETLFLTFFLTLMPFLILIGRNLKLLIVAIISVIPNLVVTIGGAELTAYSTHYHSMYLPVIITLGAISLTNSKIYTKEKMFGTNSFTVLIAISFIIGFLANTHYTNINSPNTNYLNRFESYIKKVADDFGLIPPDVYTQRSATRSEYIDSVDSLKKLTGLSISAPEMFMPALTAVGFGSIDYFPIGVGQNRLIIVPFTTVNFDEVEISIYGLVPEKNRLLWSNEILKTLRKDYSLVTKKSGIYGHIAIFKKI